MAATITRVAIGGGFGTTSYQSGLFSANAGDWLVAVACIDNNASSGAASPTHLFDVQFNVFTSRVRATYSPTGTTSDGATISIATLEVPTSFVNDRAFLSFASAANCVFSVYRVEPGSGETLSFVSGASAGGANTTSYTVGPVSVTDGDTIFCAAAIETDDTVTGDSDTTNGTWSTIDNVTVDLGADADSYRISSQYKTVTATGNQTWTATTVAARDSKTGYVIIRSEGEPAFIQAGFGSYAVTGTEASPLHSWKVAAGAGSYSVTGVDQNLNKGKTLFVSSEVGSYTVTGTAASPRHDWKVIAGAGSYTVTGSDVDFLLLSPRVFAGVGSYTVTGSAVTFVKGRKVVAGAGSYTVTGADQSLNKGKTLTAAAGSYTVTGTAASPEHGWKVTAAAGSYAVTGTSARLLLSSAKFIEVDAGSYLVTGKTALLEHDEDPDEVRGGGMPLKMYAPRVHNYVELTPAVQAAAYSANDIVFIATEVPNASWRTTPGGEEMMLESIAILDEADNPAANWTFYFGRSTFTLGSINGAVNISDSDARLITSVYTLASANFADLTNSMLGYATNLGLSVIPADGSKSLYVAATTAGTPTFGSTSDIKLKLHFVS